VWINFRKLRGRRAVEDDEVSPCRRKRSKGGSGFGERDVTIILNEVDLSNKHLLS